MITVTYVNTPIQYGMGARNPDEVAIDFSGVLRAVHTNSGTNWIRFPGEPWRRTRRDRGWLDSMFGLATTDNEVLWIYCELVKSDEIYI